MQRVTRSTAVAQLPAAPAGGKPGYFAKPDTGGIPATVPGYEWYNSMQEELAAIIEGSGMTLDGTKFNQAFQAIRRIAQKSVILTDTGAVNAYAAANSPAFAKVADLADGLTQQVRIATTNNGASTYSPDAIGGDPILGLGLQPLQGGELVAGGIAVLYRMTMGKTVNGGNPFWLLMECAGGAQQVAPATQSGHAVQLGQMQAAIAAIPSPNSYRNLLVNGAMRIAQQYGTTLLTPPALAVDQWVLDQWRCGAAQANKYTAQQVPGPLQLGFDSYLQLTSTSAYVSQASDYFDFYQYIEAQNLTALAWGTPNAKPVSLQFVVKASVAGTYSGALINAAATRSYPFTFVIPTANVDTLITIPNIPGDTSGAWTLSGTGIGLGLVFDLGCGANKRSTAGSWQPGAYFGVTGAASLLATAGATLNLTGAQLEVGPFCTAFERPTPEAELARCQRYLPCVSGYGDWITGFSSTSTTSIFNIRFDTPARIAPTGLICTPANFYVYGPSTAGYVPTAIAIQLIGMRYALLGATTSSGSPSITVGNGASLEFILPASKLVFTGAQL